MSKTLDYKKLLRDGFAELGSMHAATKEEYLSGYIFQFVTYDDGVDEIMAPYAVDVCEAITKSTTYEYIRDQQKRLWYTLMLNTRFFADRVEWGASVRGAWWKKEISFQSCGLFSGHEQLWSDMVFTQDEWVKFMNAVVDFYRESAHEQ